MTATNEDRTHDGTQRFSVQQAADVLGISTEATRQRIKRGTLPTERDESGNVFVVLNTDGTHPYADSTRTNDDRTVDGTALIKSQQDQIEYLRQQLDKEREANRENRRLLAAALERIPAIEAPPDTPSEPREFDISASDGRADGDVPPEQEKSVSGWWRRLFSG